MSSHLESAIDSIEFKLEAEFLSRTDLLSLPGYPRDPYYQFEVSAIHRTDGKV